MTDIVILEATLIKMIFFFLAVKESRVLFVNTVKLICNQVVMVVIRDSAPFVNTHCSNSATIRKKKPIQ